jgi:choline dehydrogenase
MHEKIYDYVIAGAGSAGCVLAQRLSADPSCQVLLIEAGGEDRTMEVRMPAAFTKLFKSERDWAYSTEPQPGLAGRSLYWPRGKMLGGSSSMNAQMWIRGHRADYDGWEQAGNAGWNWQSAQRAFQRAERASDLPRDVYGANGPLYIEAQRDPNRTTHAFLAACSEAGHRRLGELNEPDNEGCGEVRVNQRKGRRWSAADGYLRPSMARRNLHVVTGALVQRVVIENGSARGVEYLSADDHVVVAKARREVLLSAGAIGSPQILMLSGIGPAAQLAALGVDVVHDSAEVGENLQDHLVAAVIVACPEPITLVAAESPGNLLKYFLLRKGMLTSCVGEAASFVRTRAELSAPDVELIFAPVPYMDHGLTPPPGHGLTIGVVLLQPESRGRIRLRSKDAQAAPAIDPRYMSDANNRDLDAMVEGVRIAKRLFASEALARFAGEPIEPGPGADSTAALSEFVQVQAETLYHPVGTCRMGADAQAVVDPALRVRGVSGLRVVDASVMPRITRGHTHAPTIMIAERAADLIAGAR